MQSISIVPPTWRERAERVKERKSEMRAGRGPVRRLSLTRYKGGCGEGAGVRWWKTQGVVLLFVNADRFDGGGTHAGWRATFSAISPWDRSPLKTYRGFLISSPFDYSLQCRYCSPPSKRNLRHLPRHENITFPRRSRFCLFGRRIRLLKELQKIQRCMESIGIKNRGF